MSFEVIGPEDQAMDEVSGVPKQFVVGFSEAQHAWERVNIFFSSYTSGGRVQELSTGSSATVVSNGSDSKDSYFYQVERTSAPDGFQYVVYCEPHGAAARDELADRNARNLAHFIRDGRLEVSLLAR